MPEIFTNSPQDDTVAKQIRNLLRDMKSDQLSVVDSNERIQQQLAKINEDENLASGERIYDDG